MPDGVWDYDWCCRSWGVKWDVTAELVGCKAGYAAFQFDSPWGPPSKALEKISHIWPSLKFKLEYEEPGMGFAGEAEYQDGLKSQASRDVVYEED